MAATSSGTAVTAGFACVGGAWREMAFEVKLPCCDDLEIKAVIKLSFTRRIVTECNR